MHYNIYIHIYRYYIYACVRACVYIYFSTKPIPPSRGYLIVKTRDILVARTGDTTGIEWVEIRVLNILKCTG